MNNRIKANLQGGSLGAALTASGTTITFALAPGFATLANSDYVALTIEPNGGSGVAEIVHMTAYTAGATTGTIVRGQEGTAGVAHSNGSPWTHAPTALDFPPFNDQYLTATTASITVSGIPLGWATIEVDYYLRCDYGAVNAALLMQINGDTAADYEHNFTLQSGTTAPTGNQGLAQIAAQVGYAPGVSTMTKGYSTGRIHIVNYQDSTHDKEFLFWGSLENSTSYSNNNQFSVFGVGFWHPTTSASVSSLKLYPAYGSLVAGSRVVTRLI